MSKAILVMDMPIRCGQCPFHYATHDDNCNVVDKCQLLDKEIDGYRKKYSDCPLREVPQKKEYNHYQDYGQVLIEGYSDYTSKSALLDFLKEEIKQDRPDDFKIRNIQRYIEDIPTLDEKEIIRKAFERVVERLEVKKRSDNTESDREWGKYIGYVDAIKIVKEECGISE